MAFWPFLLRQSPYYLAFAVGPVFGIIDVVCFWVLQNDQKSRAKTKKRNAVAPSSVAATTLKTVAGPGDAGGPAEKTVVSFGAGVSSVGITTTASTFATSTVASKFSSE